MSVGCSGGRVELVDESPADVDGLQSDRVLFLVIPRQTGLVPDRVQLAGLLL